MEKMCIDGSSMCLNSIAFLQKQSYVEALTEQEGEGMLYLEMGLGREPQIFLTSFTFSLLIPLLPQAHHSRK